MTPELPDAIDCRPLADDRSGLSGSIAADRLKRVADAYTVMSEATVALEFARDGIDRITVEGSIDVALTMRCQRCLESMGVALRANVSAVAVESETARIGDDEDLIDAPGGMLSLRELVEDEILLACPMIPVHEEPTCRAPQDDAAPQLEQRRRPFAGLDEMIKNRD